MATNGRREGGGKLWLAFLALFEKNVLDLCVCFVIIIVPDSLNFACHRLSVAWVYTSKLTNHNKKAN